jgi:hypothetical protein
MKTLSTMNARFGGIYTRLTAFIFASVSKLEKAVTDYGKAKIEVSPSGLLVKLSLTYVGKKDKS